MVAFNANGGGVVMYFETMVDAEVKAFIAQKSSCYPEPVEPPTVLQIRKDSQMI